MGYNFVIQPFHDFRKWETEGYRTRDAHFFEHLKGRKDVDKVVIIDRPLSLAERILKNKSKGHSKGKVIFHSSDFEILQLDEKVFIFDFYMNDFFMPIIQRRKWWDSSLRSSKVQKEILYGLDYLKIDDYILLLQNPMSVGLIENLNPRISVFDAIDNWLEHEQMREIEKISRRNYHEIDIKADLIISVSNNNKKLFPQNHNFHEITNGVDIDSFKVETQNKPDFVDSKNIIGYVGKIQNRFDFELLETLLKKYKEYTFNIYGPIYSGKTLSTRLENRYANVHFLGEISYEELPEILHSFEIGIIPHKINEFTRSMNPLKAYEYLAAGIPVISTGVSGVSNLSPFLVVGEDTEQFISRFDEMLSIVPTITRKSVQDSLGSSVLWEEKINQLVELIEVTNENIEINT